MPVITYQGKDYECSASESLLDGINSQGGNLPYGCRSGLCQGCMVKAVKGTPPAAAQIGIKPVLKDKGYFLSCLCKPESDYEIVRPDRRDEYLSAIVTGHQHLNKTVIELRLSIPEGFRYQPGQFVNLIRPEDGLSRSYSLANSEADDHLRFHVRLLPGGKMSSWIGEELKEGDAVLISDAMGDCCYREAYSERPLLLAGTGTGLAPLYGIIRSAIAAGHRQQIRLVHGGLTSDDLYYDQKLRQLAAEHEQITYIPTVLHGPAPEGGLSGSIDALIPAQLQGEKDWVAYLCGDSAIVGAMRRCCFALGVDESSIHCDGFG